jgi:Ser/Thr protein kinase RdoA (MazF antagonist)
MSSATCSIPLIHDPVLPQRDLLLDPDFMAELFARNLGVNGPIVVEKCEHLRTTYHPRESLRIAYRVSAGEHSSIVAGRAFPHGAGYEALEQVKVQMNCGPFRRIFRHTETETIFWTFPNDRRIANLTVLLEIPQELAQLFPSPWTRSSVVAYAPEKAATAQCLDDHGEVLAYAKVYVDDHSRTCMDTYAAVRQGLREETAEVQLPRVIFQSDQHHILILQALCGRQIAALEGRELGNAFERLGRALAWLHGIPAPSHLTEFPRFQNAYMQAAASKIAMMRPELAQLASELAEQLCSQKKEMREPSVCLHGDVHPKNGILLEDGLALIDLDQASLGPRAADIGSFLAALCYERHTGRLSEADERELANAFLAGYQSIAALPEPESLRWHMAAALLAERSLRAVSRVRLPGLACLSELLLDSHRILMGRDA